MKLRIQLLTTLTIAVGIAAGALGGAPANAGTQAVSDADRGRYATPIKPDNSPGSRDFRDCNDFPGTICLTDNNDWTGHVWRQFPSQISGCRSFSPDGFNDKATIASNYSNRAYILWDHHDCTGDAFFVYPGEAWDFGANGGFWNDRFSAIELL
jgi:hypothetical protein